MSRAWTDRRPAGRLVRRLASMTLVVVALAVFPVGCGSDEAGDTILSIDQALAAQPGQAVRVQGMLIATGTQTLLASALLESYPPQAGGSTLALEGLDLEALVGLSSTVERPDLARVTWSDYPVVLEGKIDDGVLEVEKTPLLVEASTAEAKVRFSPAADPLMVNSTVWWVFDVKNLTAEPLELTFPTGQMGEIVFSREGVELYRWSEGRSFIQAVTVDTLQPGRSRAIVLNDRLTLAPGDYDVTAKVTAFIGPEGSSASLPEIATIVTVR